MPEASRHDEDILFTVFTPTYNRAHTLDRVYHSLVNQTYENFEWLIVDDGSTDDTRSLVQSWVKEAKFTIRYYWQENSGKHVAFNRAVGLAQGTLFLPADSDDDFYPNALERFLYHWRSIPDNKRNLFTGVTVRCADEAGALIGNDLPANPLDSDSLEVRYVHKVRGERWGFHRRNVLTQFPFPEPPGYKFVPEGVVWGRIARSYKTRYVNEALRIYRQDAGNQLMKQYKSVREYAFARFYYLEVLNSEFDYFWYAAPGFFKVAVKYVRESLLAGDYLLRQYRQLDGISQKLIWLAALPVASIFTLRCILKERILR
jgi:glycosyltransferase involved in cell wall biosynthesis